MERRPWVGKVSQHVLLGAREVPLPREEGRAENGLLVRALQRSPQALGQALRNPGQRKLR
eukprot:15455617-Alexandrium_andersonii.AAC.1